MLYLLNKANNGFQKEETLHRPRNSERTQRKCSCSTLVQIQVHFFLASKRDAQGRQVLNMISGNWSVWDVLQPSILTNHQYCAQYVSK